jgi:flagellin-like protein
MLNYRKFRKNAKAISPVISVLLMIAVAVAASLVTYAWVMGYLNFTTTKVGKAIQIQSIDAAAGNAFVQNVGDSAVTLSAAYMNGTQVDQPAFTNTQTQATDGVLQPGETASFDLGTQLSNGDKVTIKVTTTDGTFIESTQYIS